MAKFCVVGPARGHGGLSCSPFRRRVSTRVVVIPIHRSDYLIQKSMRNSRQTRDAHDTRPTTGSTPAWLLARVQHLRPNRTTNPLPTTRLCDTPPIQPPPLLRLLEHSIHDLRLDIASLLSTHAIPHAVCSPACANGAYCMLSQFSH